MHTSKLVLSAAALAVLARADPNDWVNPAYMQAAANHAPVGTTKAMQSILHQAAKSAKGGPWMLTNSTVFAPSGNPRDYFSWAPYHWPDCNWCNASHVNSTNSGPAAPAPTLADSGGQESDGSEEETESLRKRAAEGQAWDSRIPLDWTPENETSIDTDRPVGRSFNALSNFRRPVKRDHNVEGTPVSDVVSSEASPSSSTLQDASTAQPTAAGLPNDGYAHFDVKAPARSKPPPAAVTASRAAQAGADKGPQVSATKAPSSSSKAPSCTVSSTYVAPTATYSVCKYIRKDGQVNPDVRTLNASDYMGKVTQAGIMNALAWVLTKDGEYSRVSASYIDAYFASNTTGMSPNLNYGQIVRGPPGNQLGSFMAVVDLRGITRVANAVQILRQTAAPDWTLDRDRRMVVWAKSYLNWLQTSDIGKKSAAAANNHATFHANQIIALQILIGDYAGAKGTISTFFSTTFKEQITATGEQPFEAVRTHPYHYRAFNLEGLIVIAKLADQLGVNVWQAQSKYGATIQTAIDFTMKLDPKSEDVQEMVPHVMVAAVAYGDPKGKYIAWIKATLPEYDTKTYWAWNQIGAFTASPTSAKKPKAKRSQIFVQPDNASEPLEEENEEVKPVAGSLQKVELQPLPVSYIPAVEDFNHLEPPLSLVKRLTARATRLFARSSNSTGTISSDWAAVLRSREGNNFGQA